MAAAGSHAGTNSLNVTVSLPWQLTDPLDARAKVEGLTRSATIRKAVAFYLDRMNREGAAPMAMVDTRPGLALCALREEDFPALEALRGKRVRVVEAEKP